MARTGQAQAKAKAGIKKQCSLLKLVTVSAIYSYSAPTSNGHAAPRPVSAAAAAAAPAANDGFQQVGGKKGRRKA